MTLISVRKRFIQDPSHQLLIKRGRKEYFPSDIIGSVSQGVSRDTVSLKGVTDGQIEDRLFATLKQSETNPYHDKIPSARTFKRATCKLFLFRSSLIANIPFSESSSLHYDPPSKEYQSS